MSEIKLKPCPFCGWEAEVYFVGVEDCFVACCNPDCFMYNNYVVCDDENLLIEQWNTRKPVDAVLDRLEDKMLVSGSQAQGFSVCGTFGEIIDEREFGCHQAYADAIDIIKEELT